ncbi:hypothetical protein COOONC_23693 [Cooperia oncophora]
MTYIKVEKRCFGCFNDMKCFVDRLHALLIQYHNGVRSKDRKIKRFNNYYIRHFAPQTWFCEFKKRKNEYIIMDYGSGPDRTQKVANDFQKLFKQAQVPDHHLRVIYAEMMKGKTKHSTSMSCTRKMAEEQLFSNEYLMRRVMQMYYFDFIEFGFL